MKLRPVRYLATVMRTPANSFLSLGFALALVACDTSRQNASPRGSPPAVPPAAASDTASGPLVVEDHAIIGEGAVGPLRLGTWRRPVMSLVYAVGATAGPAGEDVITVRGIGKDTLTLAFVDDTLRRIAVRRPGAHTSDGLAVGVPWSAVTNQPGATASASTSGTTVVTLARYCGVQFRSDTSRREPARIGEIVVGPCTEQDKRPAAPR